MKKIFLNKILRFIPPLLIVFVGIFLAYKNYTPGTLLSGWDTLHPEFNFILALKRVFFGVWREEQGVGALAAHSHMSEIPRIILLWIISFFTPVNFLRYFYVFLGMLVGPLGIYFFIQESQENKNTKNLYLSVFTSLAYSAASICFLLNLENLQNFYVPFEMFITLFASIGWLFYFALKVIKTGSKKYFLLFFLTSILSSPMAFAATLFYSWLISFSLFLISFSLLTKEKKQNIKRSLIILVLVFTANAYWILPNIYSIKNQSEVISKATINRLFTSEAFLSNKAYGDIKDVVIGKNHLFSWREYDFKNQEFVNLLDEWNTYLGSNYVQIMSYILISLTFLGLIFAVLKKDKVGIALIPVLILSLFFLINENPPFTYLYSFLRKNLNIFNEGFRMPFTKFSIIFIFVKTYFLAFFAKTILELLNKKKLERLFGPILILGLFFVIIKPMLPAFWGNFISPSMRNNIPSEYFELFNYMKDKPGRVAKLPMYTWSGWTYYSWGYEGAGFIPFGSINPTLDRDFDRWSSYNESFYREASKALYSEDLKSFENVLAKYQVGYLLLDKSIINAGRDEKLLLITETETLLDNSIHIKKEKEIGFLTIYKTDFAKGQSNIRTPQTFVNIDTDLNYFESDTIYQEFGDYVGEGSVSFPFVNLDKRSNLEISKDDNYIFFTRNFDKLIDVKKIIIPNTNQSLINVDLIAFYKDDATLIIKFKRSFPKIIMGDKEVTQQELTETHQFEFTKTLPNFFEIQGKIYDLRDVKIGEEKVLGSVQISANTDSTIRFFSKATLRLDLVDDLFKEKPRLCSDPNIVFPLNLTSANFELKTTTEPICFGRNFTSKKALYEFSFEAKSASDIFPQFCITQGNSKECLDNYLPDAFKGEDNGWKKFEIEIYLNQGSSWMDFVNVKNPNADEAKVNYRNFKINEYLLTGEEDFAFGSSLTTNTDSLVYDLDNKVKSLTVALPKSGEISENFNLQRGNRDAFNCDVKKEGKVFKENLGDKVIYKAEEGGVSCDFYDYPQLGYNNAYILEVKGDNVEGRGLKYYLFNKKTGRADLEEVTSAGSYDEFNTLIPQNLSGSGFTFNTETRSFGRITSENILDEFNFIPFAYGILKNIILLKGDVNPLPETQKNNLEVINVKKTGTYKYTVDVRGEGLLVLSQGYDSGWTAFKLPNYKVLKHLKVNSWENGWEVSATNSIVILYWPQYLEFIGFTLLVAGLLGIILKKQSLVDKY